MIKFQKSVHIMKASIPMDRRYHSANNALAFIETLSNVFRVNAVCGYVNGRTSLCNTEINPEHEKLEI